MSDAVATSPRLGFLGVGWIGRSRLDALADAGARVAAIADPSEAARSDVAAAYPDAAVGSGLDALLGADLDGVVIATPSALHAKQSRRALEAGRPVFCQKPLGRTEEETARVVETARASDLLLGVDMSYRHTAALRAIRERVEAGDLGELYAADLVFHNAYGPDKDWFYDPTRSGGGCVMDLGIHLVDIALWLLGGPIERVDATLYADGRRLRPREDRVEDYADVRLGLGDDRNIRLTCSWNLNAGRDAVIVVRLYGTEGGAAMVNVDGSFYDFRADLFRGTATEVLALPPDDWGGRAAVAWADRLGRDPSYDPAVEEMVEVASVLDRIYGR